MPERATSPGEAGLLPGNQLGMVVDNSTGSATVFNAVTNTVLGTVAGLGAGALASGDCSITADGKRGFFTRFSGSVTAVDLTGPVPVPAPAPNPITIANPGEDTSLSPDGQFLLVCDGSATAPVSVINVATQTQIGTFNTGSDCNSVEICSDNSVLVTSFNFGNVRRLKLSPTGTLTDTGESMAVTTPWNTMCAPNAKTAVVVDTFSSVVRSFKIPGLTTVSNIALSSPVTGAINHVGNKLYVRTSLGQLVNFAFDQTTGVIGAPAFTVPVAGIATFFGMDQVAVHPTDATVYVPEPGKVRILDAGTGATVGQILGSALNGATGICFGPGPVGNQPPVAKCADRVVPADGTCHASANINDGSFDPDADDTITCFQSPLGPFERGVTTATLTCTDSHMATASCTAKVTVLDVTPPTAVCPGDQLAECNDGAGGAVVSFSIPATDACDASPTTNCEAASGSTFGLGTTVDACRATDDAGNAAFCTHSITVVDTQPPVVDPVEVPELWPPLHDYHVVDLADCMEPLVDACQGPLDIATHAKITCCTSDEPDIGLGDGDLPKDCALVSTHSVKLRAERFSAGNGRVYTIHFTVTDGSNKTTDHTCKVGVPHTRIEGPAVDDGPITACNKAE